MFAPIFFVYNFLCSCCFSIIVYAYTYATAGYKGWFCGCIHIIKSHRKNKTAVATVDGTALSSIQGLPITREWIDRSTKNAIQVGSSSDDGSNSNICDDLSSSQFPTRADGNRGGVCASDFRISSNAKCILVIEKEGVYNRLSEDRFYDRYPCILVTGRGFPDLATRALVHTLHNELNLPVLGLCDCNPYGIGVLQTYQVGNSTRLGRCDGGKRYGVPIQWVGLRPSLVCRMRRELPRVVFQKLTDMDKKRIDRLLCHGSILSPFLSNGRYAYRRKEEVLMMKKMGFKVELEALNWLGMDYMCAWLEEVIQGYDHTDFGNHSKEEDVMDVI